MSDLNIIQRILDTATLNGQTFANIQADAQGRVDTHAVEGIHAITPASGDLIVGSSGTWVKLPKGVDSRVLRMIKGVVTWDTGNGILSFIPALGDMIVGGSGSWNRLVAGTDDDIIRMVGGVPEWDTDSAKDSSIIGQWGFISLTQVAASHPQALSNPRTGIGSVTFNSNGTWNLTNYLKQGDQACYAADSISGTWTQDATGVYKMSVGSYHWQVIVAGNVAMMFLSSVIDTVIDIGFANYIVMARGVDLAALTTEYTANLCTKAKPTGAIKGAMVSKGSFLPEIVAGTLTAVTWENSINDMAPAFWSSSAPTKFTIPYGVSQVKLRVNVHWETPTVFDGWRLVSIQKNGNWFHGGFADKRECDAVGFVSVNLSTATLAVVEGDYFEIIVGHTSTSVGGVGIGGDANICWYALEVVA